MDGQIGGEWAGAAFVNVGYNPAAPTSNFGAPTNENHNVGYTIFTRRDANYFYAGLVTTGPTDASSLLFSNLYFAVLSDNGAGVSTIGFETTLDRAFKPGVANTTVGDTAANLIQTVAYSGTPTDADVIEVAIDLSVFTSNALGVAGFTGIPSGATPFGILMTLSQSFGYSVVGGTDPYGPSRLGFVELTARDIEQTVPEPAPAALIGLALGALALTRRRVK